MCCGQIFRVQIESEEGDMVSSPPCHMKLLFWSRLTGLKQARWWIDWSCVQIQEQDTPKNSGLSYPATQISKKCRSQVLLVSFKVKEKKNLIYRNKVIFRASNDHFMLKKDCLLWLVWRIQLLNIQHYGRNTKRRSKYVSTCVSNIYVSVESCG